MTGRLFAVVGPSGVGKDTLLAGARAELRADPGFVFPRRIITRPAGDGTEDHLSVGEDAFASLERSGAFLVAWRAHGFAYAIPAGLKDDLASGRHGVVNVSRTVVADLAARHPLTVLLVRADPEILRARLLARGREDAHEVAARLRREPPSPAAHLDVAEISNDGPAADSVAAMVAVLRSRTARNVGRAGDPSVP